MKEGIGWREIRVMTLGEFFYWLLLRWKVARLKTPHARSKE